MKNGALEAMELYNSNVWIEISSRKQEQMASEFSKTCILQDTPVRFIGPFLCKTFFNTSYFIVEE
jgi:hypothetical protein